MYFDSVLLAPNDKDAGGKLQKLKQSKVAAPFNEFA